MTEIDLIVVGRMLQLKQMQSDSQNQIRPNMHFFTYRFVTSGKTQYVGIQIENMNNILYAEMVFRNNGPPTVLYECRNSPMYMMQIKETTQHFLKVNELQQKSLYSSW